MTPNRLLWIVVLAGGLVAALGRAGLAEDPRLPEQEVITMRGEPMKVWPFDDLRARGFDIPEVPREENAFWGYLEAINAFKDVPPDVKKAFDYALSKAWPAGYDEKLKEYVLDRDNQKALTLARRAAAGEQCQFYYFGDPNGSIISVLLPSLSNYRFLGKLLVVDGRRLEAQGAYDLALRNYATAMRMGDHVARGVTLIENLVGVAVWALGDRAVLEMALRRDLSAAQLEEILDLLDELGPSCPSARSGVQNERVFGMNLVDELTARPFHLFSNLQSLGGAGTDVGAPAAQYDGWRRLEARVGRLALPDRTVKQHMAWYYDQLIERAGQPAYAARWNEFDEEGAVRSIPQWNVIARIMLPSLSRASTLGERCRMQTLATRLAVALRLFAKENEGEAPRRLGQLGERIPAEGLIDPFSGAEFVYEHRAGAWRLYSFSDNLVDDGGREGEKLFEPDYVVRFPPADLEPFVPDEGETE